MSVSSMKCSLICQRYMSQTHHHITPCHKSMFISCHRLLCHRSLLMSYCVTDPSSCLTVSQILPHVTDPCSCHTLSQICAHVLSQIQDYIMLCHRSLLMSHCVKDRCSCHTVSQIFALTCHKFRVVSHCVTDPCSCHTVSQNCSVMSQIHCYRPIIMSHT